MTFGPMAKPPEMLLIADRAVPLAVRMRDEYTTSAGGNTVALVRLGRIVVGVVGEDEDEVDIFVSRLRTNVAGLLIDAPVIQ